MKKGISLIVLVITVIIMIIIAGAIIMTISQTDIINNSTEATEKSNLATAKSVVALTFSNDMAIAEGTINIGTGETYTTVAAYKTHLEDAIAAAFGEDFSDLDYEVTVTANDEETKISSVNVSMKEVI